MLPDGTLIASLGGAGQEWQIAWNVFSLHVVTKVDGRADRNKALIDGPQYLVGYLLNFPQ